MSEYYATKISTTLNPDDVIFYLDSEVKIELNFDWDDVNNCVSKFELTCYRQKEEPEDPTFEVKAIYESLLYSGKRIYVVHILEDGAAEDGKTFTLTNVETMQSMEFNDLFDRELFVFVMHNDESLAALNESNCRELNEAIPESKDGSIIISI